MKKLCLLLALLLLVTLAGCGDQGTTYGVYFMAQETDSDSALAPELHQLEADQDPVEALLTLLLAGPTQEGLTRTIPTGVSLRGWSQEGTTVTVDFSGRYGSLSGVALTLADYSVVLTLTQLEGVEEVIITADGQTIPYRNHQELTPGELSTPET